MKDTKAILNKILEIKKQFPNGLPPSAINIGCDVMKLYPSIDSTMGLEAVKKWLRLYPNPDGLPLQLIMDLDLICVEENASEFMDGFFCPNCGTATGPPHACDFADIFMGELDEYIVRELDRRGVPTAHYWLDALQR